MSNALANVYSFGNKLRNNLKALLTDPVNHLASQANIWAADMNRALDSPATAYRRAGGVMADDPSTVAAANREQERMTAALMGTAPGFVGMTAWHGSPHKFDRFDSSKIGTGEGAQAYGHGLYLAESPKTAEAYRQALSTWKTTLNGQPLTPDHPQFAAAMHIGAQGYEGALKQAKEAKRLGFLTPEFADQEIAKIVALKDAKITAVKDGHVYKVDLPDEMIARMLDWDKPLSQQPGMVQKVFDNSWQHSLYRKRSDQDVGQFTGADLVNAFGADSHSRALFADDLRKAGIPGIRYLDGGSRGTGSGTSNFVIFPGEENALRILERNGMTLADMAGQSGKIDSRLLAALGLGSAAAVAGNSLLNSGKKKMEDAKKARQQAIEKAEEK